MTPPPESRTRCHVCGKEDALPAVLRPDFCYAKAWLTEEILNEYLCGPCWTWTIRVASACRMHQILKGVL